MNMREVLIVAFAGLACGLLFGHAFGFVDGYKIGKRVGIESTISELERQTGVVR